MNESNEQLNQVEERYMEFSLGDERFALPLLQVREVIAIPETTKVPFTPYYFVGIMNLRGQILSIIDLAKRIGINPSQSAKERAVIIVDLPHSKLGFVVDNINRVMALDSKSFTENTDINRLHNLEYIKGCFRQAEELVLVLNLDHLFPSSELKSISELAQAC